MTEGMDRPPLRPDQPRWRRVPPPGSVSDPGEDVELTPVETPSVSSETPTAAGDAETAQEMLPIERVAPPRVQYTDPSFGLLIASALNIGLIPIVPDQADLRYVLVWIALGAAGVFPWLLGETERIGRERIDRVLWGVVLGVILGGPLLFVGGSTLETTVRLMFRTGQVGADALAPLPPGAVLGLLVFAMPTAETLFFRGLLQNMQPFWLTGLISSSFAIFLFFPMIEVARYPLVAVVIGIALTAMNLFYSYVRARRGLAAAWLSQITVNVIVFWIPYVS
ncbi:MAG: hypothetical protein NZM00_11835 [Anaerolinea sp.]|nr:hypothetical protein [Anaerolinea sp.]